MQFQAQDSVREKKKAVFGKIRRTPDQPLGHLCLWTRHTGPEALQQGAPNRAVYQYKRAVSQRHCSRSRWEISTRTQKELQRLHSLCFYSLHHFWLAIHKPKCGAPTIYSPHTTLVSNAGRIRDCPFCLRRSCWAIGVPDYGWQIDWVSFLTQTPWSQKAWPKLRDSIWFMFCFGNVIKK